MSILEVQGLKKVYSTRFGGNKVEALKNVNFSVEAGEYVAIMGESGTGKTTLLNILAALDTPTSGSVLLDGKELSGIKESAWRHSAGTIWALCFRILILLDTFTLEDNIFLPLVLAGTPYKEMFRRLAPIAQRLGMTELLKKYPYEVSGGQKQRAAVARALITEPRLILADEPTGALDSRATDELLRLFARDQPRGADHPHGDPLASRPPATPGGCCSSRTARCSTSCTGATTPTSSCIRRSATTLTALTTGGNVAMKVGFFATLAVNGIRKNARLYVPYLLTCAGMVMMFYIVSYLQDTPPAGGYAGRQKHPQA